MLAGECAKRRDRYNGLDLLVIVAHPDDESLYAAGLINQVLSCGGLVGVVSLTRGERGRTLGLCGRHELASLREMEFREVMKALGVTASWIHTLKDKALFHADYEAALDYIVITLLNTLPAAIATYPADGVNGHTDHIATNRIVRQAVRRTGSTIELLTFHAHRSLTGDSCTAGITIPVVADIKARALANYRSQALSVVDFLRKAPGTMSAECFIK